MCAWKGLGSDWPYRREKVPGETVGLTRHPARRNASAVPGGVVLPLAIVGEGVGSNGRGADAFALSPHAGCPIPLAASRYCKQG